MMSKTSVNKKALIDQLRKSPIVQVTCEKTGISRATYYRWRKDDVEFAEACDQALYDGSALVNDMAESQLLSAIRDKNLTAIIFWLKHHHKTYETRVNVQGTIRHQAEALTDEQSELVERALQLAGLLTIKENDNEFTTTD
jgi:ACT domain-containing protein